MRSVYRECMSGTVRTYEYDSHYEEQSGTWPSYRRPGLRRRQSTHQKTSDGPVTGNVSNWKLKGRFGNRTDYDGSGFSFVVAFGLLVNVIGLVDLNILIRGDLPRYKC